MTAPVTFSLEEYAAAVLGDPVEPAKVQWLEKRLRRGDLPGFKAGRRWRATQSDIESAIESLRPKQVAVPEVPRLSGMTRTSRRRMKAS